MSRRVLRKYRLLTYDSSSGHIYWKTGTGSIWAGGSGNLTVASGFAMAMSGHGDRALYTPYSGGVVYPLSVNPSTDAWTQGTGIAMPGNPNGVSIDFSGSNAIISADSTSTVKMLRWNTGTGVWGVKTTLTLTTTSHAAVVIASAGTHALAAAKTTAYVTPLELNSGTDTWTQSTPIPLVSASHYGIAMSRSGEWAIVCGSSGVGTTFLRRNMVTRVWSVYQVLAGDTWSASFGPDDDYALTCENPTNKIFPVIFDRVTGLWSRGTYFLANSGPQQICIIQDGIGLLAVVASWNAVTQIFRRSQATGIWSEESSFGTNRALAAVGAAVYPTT
jgi:hypothetical protein